MIYKFNFIILLFLLIRSSIIYAESDYAYRVELTGINDEATTKLLFGESQLISLIDNPPVTATSCSRIDDDIIILLKALQSAAFYNASIKPSINRSVSPILIQLAVDTGPIYSFSSFTVISDDDSEECFNACNFLTLKDLGIDIGTPAYPAAIIEAEENLLMALEKRGYPLAKLSKREVFADVSSETVSVNLSLNCGPQAFFGETDICGNEDLLPVFFCRKIAWNKGALYNPESVQRTLDALELSGLFSSINITHDDSVQEDGTLPMHIIIKEAKQRSVGFGVGYATDLGPGVNAEWEHRNISGTGDKLSLVANLWQIRQECFIRYIQPDFLRPRQDLIWAAEVEHEDVKAFREASFNLSGTIERQLNDRLRISYGGMFTRLRNTHSDNNRTFSLLKFLCNYSGMGLTA